MMIAAASTFLFRESKGNISGYSVQMMRSNGLRCCVVEYTFEDLKGDLEIGHELHFRYNGKEYSISHSQNGWHLCEFYKDDQTFKTQWDLLKYGTINGIHLSEIWLDVEVMDIF